MERAIQSEISSSSCGTDERMREYREAIARTRLNPQSAVQMAVPFYPGDGSYEESVILEVSHPCDQFTLVIEFPRRYPVKPYPMAVDQNGNAISVAGPRFSFQPDKLANRFSFVVRRPLLQSKYSIRWQVPDI